MTTFLFYRCSDNQKSDNQHAALNVSSWMQFLGYRFCYSFVSLQSIMKCSRPSNRTACCSKIKVTTRTPKLTSLSIKRVLRQPSLAVRRQPQLHMPSNTPHHAAPSHPLQFLEPFQNAPLTPHCLAPLLSPELYTPTVNPRAAINGQLIGKVLVSGTRQCLSGALAANV